MMSTTTSRVQPLVDDEEETEGGLRRITGTDTSGDRDDEALPPVGGSIGVVSHPDGYQYVVKARLEELSMEKSALEGMIMGY